jgi:hypothetical protein
MAMIATIASIAGFSLQLVRYIGQERSAGRLRFGMDRFGRPIMAILTIMAIMAMSPSLGYL